MSLEAYVWASRLPMDVCGVADYRVLILLADHAHKDGRNAWRATESIAAELHCSQRTIQRAIRNLKVLGLIHLGDQRLTQHLRADRRPQVYDLNLQFATPFAVDIELDGVTTAVAPYGVTKLSRGDSQSTYGVTTAVAQGTVIEPLNNSSTRRNHTQPVAPCGHDLIDDRHCALGCPVRELVDA